MKIAMDDDRPEPEPSGQPLRLEDLLAAQLPALRAFLRTRAGDAIAARESVDDLAQSVCREVLQDRSQLAFEDEASFRSYLFLQAVRKVIDRARYYQMDKRDRRRERPLPGDEDIELDANLLSRLASGTRIMTAREQLERVENCIRDLPEAQREAVLLSRIAGLSYAEIAKHKGIAESTVRSLAARGLAKISLDMHRLDTHE
ncbi:MAG: RNA polymerase sigma factor [Planctomycetota bacterium]